jgi:hypothetical protein
VTTFQGIKTNVDDETLRANLARKTTTGPVRVYQDPDGYEFIEQDFEDGSKVIMHRHQYEAIAVEAARLARQDPSFFSEVSNG